jgi:hypothetical protein
MLTIRSLVPAAQPTAGRSHYRIVTYFLAQQDNLDFALRCSLAVPVSGGELCFTSNLLDVAPLRTSVIPVHGSAAGSTILASEAATFRLDRCGTLTARAVQTCHTTSPDACQVYGCPSFRSGVPEACCATENDDVA